MKWALYLPRRRNSFKQRASFFKRDSFKNRVLRETKLVCKTSLVWYQSPFRVPTLDKNESRYHNTRFTFLSPPKEHDLNDQNK